MPSFSRREFLVGCSATIAAMAGARINQVVFAEPGASSYRDILITVFLRGGCDALNLIPPIAGADRGYYVAARPDIHLATAGQGAALPLNAQFGLHPSAGGLHDLYQDNKLAIVQAVGLNEDTRSHFDAMAYMELGTPGTKSTSSGWLTRHLQTINASGSAIIPAVAAGNTPPTSMVGYTDAATLGSTSNFNMNIGPYRWREQHQEALRELYQANSTDLHLAGQQTMGAVDALDFDSFDDYVPSNGAVYPSGSFGDRLRMIAFLIKQDIGLQVANVDLGGWDTHDNQGTGSTGHFGNLVQTLSEGMTAFYTDLDGCAGTTHNQNITMVVMSEFGRRLRENADRGTDHGHGGMMMVLGQNVNGGLYGNWPGLATEQLYDNADVAVTTDYRRVLSEILTKRLKNNNLAQIFPDYSGYTPMNLVQGSGGGGIVAPPLGEYNLFLPTVANEQGGC